MYASEADQQNTLYGEGLFVCNHIEFGHWRPRHNYTFYKYHNFPSTAASMQMKTQRPQTSDEIQSPKINSHTAKLQPPCSPENCPLPHHLFSN